MTHFRSKLPARFLETGFAVTVQWDQTQPATDSSSRDEIHWSRLMRSNRDALARGWRVFTLLYAAFGGRLVDFRQRSSLLGAVEVDCKRHRGRALPAQNLGVLQPVLLELVVVALLLALLVLPHQTRRQQVQGQRQLTPGCAQDGVIEYQTLTQHDKDTELMVIYDPSFVSTPNMYTVEDCKGVGTESFSSMYRFSSDCIPARPRQHREAQEDARSSRSWHAPPRSMHLKLRRKANFLARIRAGKRHGSTHCLFCAESWNGSDLLLLGVELERRE